MNPWFNLPVPDSTLFVPDELINALGIFIPDEPPSVPDSPLFVPDKFTNAPGIFIPDESPIVPDTSSIVPDDTAALMVPYSSLTNILASIIRSMPSESFTFCTLAQQSAFLTFVRSLQQTVFL